MLRFRKLLKLYDFEIQKTRKLHLTTLTVTIFSNTGITI